MSKHKTLFSPCVPWALFMIIFTFTLFGCTPQPTSQVTTSSEGVSIHFIDTGNSDSILIKDETSSVLIDGGDNEDGETVVNYLKQQGINKLTYMIATHPHADHIGGLDTILDAVSVDTLYVANGNADTKTYRDFIESAMNQGLTPSVPLEDSNFKLTHSSFKIFNTNGGNDANEQSLVVLFSHGNDKFLFMGDAEKGTEKELLNKMVDVDVLKLGHHGSSSSTGVDFFNKVSPEYAVIPVGTDNKYGHPHKETMTLLEKNKVEVHRNDECGTIIFISSGNGVHTDCSPGSYTPGGSKKGSVKPSTQASAQPTIKNANSNASTTVYWTPNGKSYHKTDQCRGLSKSKTILKGSISESNKSDACDLCYN